MKAKFSFDGQTVETATLREVAIKDRHPEDAHYLLQCIEQQEHQDLDEELPREKAVLAIQRYVDLYL